MLIKLANYFQKVICNSNAHINIVCQNKFQED